MIRLPASVVSLFVLLSCVDHIDGYTLAGKGAALDFDHPCSEAERNYGLYWQDFALFQGDRASVLGEVQVGWSEYDKSLYRHVFFRWEAPVGTGDRLPPWSLGFKMYNTRTGESIPGEPKFDRGNILDQQESDGDEPVARRQDAPPRAFSIGEDRIAHPEDTHVLFLVFEDLVTGEVSELEGPSLPPLYPLWDATLLPEELRRTAGAWDPLDPYAQEDNWLDIVQNAQRHSVSCARLTQHIRDTFTQ